jgi:hypothetical protein
VLGLAPRQGSPLRAAVCIALASSVNRVSVDKGWLSRTLYLCRKMLRNFVMNGLMNHGRV